MENANNVLKRKNFVHRLCRWCSIIVVSSFPLLSVNIVRKKMNINFTIHFRLTPCSLQTYHTPLTFSSNFYQLKRPFRFTPSTSIYVKSAMHIIKRQS